MYVSLGILLWLCVHESGVHATLAGILGALTIPARTRISQASMVASMRALLTAFEQKIKRDGKMLESHEQHILAEDMELSIKAASTPLQRWEESLVNPIAIIVLPLFALLNAGITLSAETLQNAFDSPVTWGVIAGLVLGKPLGVILFCVFGIWAKVGALPKNFSIFDVVGVGLLAGIGFTMSTFITALSFEHYPEYIEPAKIGILIASLASACGARVAIDSAAFRAPELVGGNLIPGAGGGQTLAGRQAVVATADLAGILQSGTEHRLFGGTLS